MTGEPPSDGPFEVEVVMGTRARQLSEQVRVAPGERVGTVLDRCTLPAAFPELAPGDLVPAIHGRRVSRAEPLRPGDRLGLLAPLQVDPREARRRRAALRQARRR